MANIAHNPLRFGEGCGSELQTQIKSNKKTTNMLDVQAIQYTLINKGTKAVTGAVPFQKVHVCT